MSSAFHTADQVADDPWSSWLNHKRDGGDPAIRAKVADETAAFAGKLLDLAPATPAAMLDIGSGTGLVAWAALARWPHLTVTLTDISAPLLAQAETEAQARRVSHQCRFLRSAAEGLPGAEAAAYDLVTSRSAIAYAADKTAAFRAAFRVLRPGGALCIAEPLFHEEALAARALRNLTETSADPLLPLLHKWKAAQFPDTEATAQANPLTNYTERDMLGFARQAGFGELHLELHIDERPAPKRDWAAFCATAPHPLAPSLTEIMATRFTPAERARFETALRPSIEGGKFMTTSRMLYLRGRKPLTARPGVA